MEKIKRYKLIILILCIFISLPFGGFTQNNGQVRKILANADKLLNEDHAIEEARQKYEHAVKLDPANVEANFKAGLTYLNSIDKHKSTGYFLKVYELDSDYRFDLNYLIGRGYQYGLEFENAIQYYKSYKNQLLSTPGYAGEDKISLKEVERRIQECENGIEFINNPKNFKITNLGDKINSHDKDYAPVLNENEDILIFTSRREKGNMNDKLADDKHPYEDIFIAYKDGDTWQEAQNIGSVVNTPYHDSNIGISPDGTKLFIYKDLNNGDIFESDRILEGVWSKPFPLKDINTQYAEKSISISPDGRYIYFSSNRPGGYGGFDLYRSEKKGDGWGKAENLGPEVNTEYDEDSPFIDYDGVSLYFSSKGWKGMGGYDIFKSVKKDNRWTKPENLGYPVNSPDDDIHFVSTQDGKRAYYASVREDSYGYSDIYMITSLEGQFGSEEPEIELQPVTLNIITQDNDGERLTADVSLSNSKTTTTINAVKKEPGIYSFTLLNSDSEYYRLKVQKPGYVTQVFEIKIPGAEEQKQLIEKNIKLNKANTNRKVYSLRNIYFDFDKTELKEKFSDRLNEVKEYLKNNPSAKLLIIGHTDNEGTEEYNMELSIKRAFKVKEYLVKNGIEYSRISIKGKGASEPLASNDDEREGRELNRRVEFIIDR